VSCPSSGAGEKLSSSVRDSLIGLPGPRVAAALGMAQFHDHVARQHLLVGQRLVEAVDPGTGDALLGQRLSQ
jgi:hypothetical protein